MMYPDQAHKELGFRIHAIVFVPSILAIAVVNAVTGPPYWIIWVVLGWGVGLFAHWLFGLRLGNAGT